VRSSSQSRLSVGRRHFAAAAAKIKTGAGEADRRGRDAQRALRRTTQFSHDAFTFLRRQKFSNNENFLSLIVIRLQNSEFHACRTLHYEVLVHFKEICSDIFA
jgi:hypothetical protein